MYASRTVSTEMPISTAIPNTTKRRGLRSRGRRSASGPITAATSPVQPFAVLTARDDRDRCRPDEGGEDGVIDRRGNHGAHGVGRGDRSTECTVDDEKQQRIHDRKHKDGDDGGDVAELDGNTREEGSAADTDEQAERR